MLPARFRTLHLSFSAAPFFPSPDFDALLDPFRDEDQMIGFGQQDPNPVAQSWKRIPQPVGELPNSSRCALFMDVKRDDLTCVLRLIEMQPSCV